MQRANRDHLSHHSVLRMLRHAVASLTSARANETSRSPGPCSRRQSGHPWKRGFTRALWRFTLPPLQTGCEFSRPRPSGWRRSRPMSGALATRWTSSRRWWQRCSPMASSGPVRTLRGCECSDVSPGGQADMSSSAWPPATPGGLGRQSAGGPARCASDASPPSGVPCGGPVRESGGADAPHGADGEVLRPDAPVR
jgi:hypothetical protein